MVLTELYINELKSFTCVCIACIGSELCARFPHVEPTRESEENSE